MTIVVQHQFWDLKVTETLFEIGLSFSDTPEKLVIPFNAIPRLLRSVRPISSLNSTVAAFDEEENRRRLPPIRSLPWKNRLSRTAKP